MSSEATSKSGDSQHELYGVRGWLLVLCLFLMIVIPLVAVLGLVGAWQSGSSLQSAVIMGIVFELALAGFAFYAGLGLYRMRPQAVAIAKVYFIAIFFLGLLGFGIVLVASLAQPNNVALSSVLRGPVAFAGLSRVLISAAWLAYLERSKRVRATYGGG